MAPPPSSSAKPLPGTQTVADLALRRQDGLDIVAVHRQRGLRLREFVKLRLMAGDTLLQAAFELMPIVILAIIAAVIVVATGCLSSEEAYGSVQWSLLILIFAMLAIGSASFATPIGYQTNTLVYQAAGYRFMDFVRIGVPMNLLMWATATLVILIFWPLVPA